jgi:fructokinase
LQLSRDFFLQQAAEKGDITALGVGCFGPVDLNTASSTFGYITTTPKPHWSNIDVAGYLSRELGIPVSFDTDVNCAALGEYRHGAAQGRPDFVYVTVGTGIGAGVFVNGRPMNGMVHTEFGHTLISRDPVKDPYVGHCPFHKDCLTALACGPAIEARWGCKGIELPADHEAWGLQADYLAVMCLNIVMSYSPRVIILGGGVMDQQHLFPKIRLKFSSLMNNYMLQGINVEDFIVPTQLNGKSGEVGAILMAMES